MYIENLPYSDESEKAVLGALLIGADINTLIAEIDLRPTDFYLEQNRMVYAAMMNLYAQDKAIDIVTVDGAMQGNPAYGGIDFIKKVAGNVPTIRNMEYYAAFVKQLSRRRNYIAMADRIQTLAADNSKDISEIVDVMEQTVLDEFETIELTPFSKLIVPTFQSLVQAYEQSGKIPGQRTGWISLDAAMGGMEGLVVVGARPAMGKTMFGTNIAEYVAFTENKPAIIFSLEMPKTQMATRILSSQTGTKHSSCKYGTLTDEDFATIGLFANNPQGDKLLICEEPQIDIHKIKSACRRCKKQYGNIGVIVIDYIQLMDTGKDNKTTRSEKIGKISRSLKLLSKELDCPIVILSQLSRDVEKRNDKRPLLSDLRDSGAIEQDADSIIFLYRDDYYNKESAKHGTAEIIIAKNRHGETRTIELSFQPQIMRFMEKSEVEKTRKEREKEKEEKREQNEHK